MKLFKENGDFVIKSIILLALGALGIIVFVVFFIWAFNAGIAEYSVWSQKKAGEARLAEATYSRQIAVKEALAKKAAAILLAQAEVERAKGVAKANTIIGQSLNQNEAYLRYLWIQNLANEHNQVIYVPTEANLPILEANRMHNGKR